MPEHYTKPNGSARGKKRYQPDPSHYLFNVDTLWYTYDADNYDFVMTDGLLQMLADGKAIADDGEKTSCLQVSLPRYEYPVTFEITASGQKPIYAYSIRNKDMAFYFARRRRNDGTYPIKVQINQFKLWDMGVKDAFLESLDVLAAMGFSHEASKPNRIDLCVHSDQFDWTLDDLRALAYPRNIEDDNKPNFHRLDPCTGAFETVYYGDRTRLQMRIYNKSIEVVKKKKEYFRELYQRHGMDPERVWNIEFEVHRDYLKGFACEETGLTGIFDTMDFLLRLDGLSLLWTHLMDKYSHPSAHWQIVRQGDPNSFVECQGHVFRLKDIDTSKEREIAQIRGRLQKLVLTEEIGEDADYMVEAMKIFVDKLHDYESEKEKDFAEDVLRKRHEYMDVTMLKKSMAERAKSSNKMVLLEDLLRKKKIHNTEVVLLKEKSAL